MFFSFLLLSKYHNCTFYCTELFGTHKVASHVEGSFNSIFVFRLSQIAAVDAMMTDHMTAMIGPMDAYSMSRVASFTTHWDILNVTPGAISRGLRVRGFFIFVFHLCLLTHLFLLVQNRHKHPFIYISVAFYHKNLNPVT